MMIDAMGKKSGVRKIEIASLGRLESFPTPTPFVFNMYGLGKSSLIRQSLNGDLSKGRGNCVDVQGKSFRGWRDDRN